MEYLTLYLYTKYNLTYISDDRMKKIKTHLCAVKPILFIIEQEKSIILMRDVLLHDVKSMIKD